MSLGWAWELDRKGRTDTNEVVDVPRPRHRQLGLAATTPLLLLLLRTRRLLLLLLLTILDHVLSSRISIKFLFCLFSLASVKRNVVKTK